MDGQKGPMERANGKLNARHRETIRLRLARFETPEELARDLTGNEGIEVSAKEIRERFLKRTRSRRCIEALRREYLDDVLSVPAANRKIRLQRLQHLLDRLENAFDWPENVADLTRLSKEYRDTLSQLASEGDGAGKQQEAAAVPENIVITWQDPVPQEGTER